MHPTPEQLIEMASSGETIGQAAFNAYRAHRCGVNHDGSPTPVWADLTDAVREGWEVAANAAVRSLVALHQIKDARAKVALTVPATRERAIAVTKLEEAEMWLERALANPTVNNPR